jgi:hypothetical protein
VQQKVFVLQDNQNISELWNLLIGKDATLVNGFFRLVAFCLDYLSITSYELHLSKTSPSLWARAYFSLKVEHSCKFTLLAIILELHEDTNHVLGDMRRMEQDFLSVPDQK